MPAPLIVKIGRLALIGAAVALTPPAAARTEASFDSWLGGVKREAAARGFKAATIESALTGLTPLPRVVELDRKQPEFTLTLDAYLRRVVSPQRVGKARAKLAEHRALLDEVAARYSVQPRFIVALWGIESDFGRLTGAFPVIRAVATLAFDGRRSAYFRKELFNALTIVDQGHIAAKAMTGSWAGAMGQNQFMPSSFLAHAVDHDGDGRRDIWTSRADVFASTANYLRSAGWRGDQTWGREIRLPQGFDASLIGLGVRKRLSEWQAFGVLRADGTALPRRDLKASIILPSGEDGPAYLAYRNYRAILKWNRAHFFAVAVGRLADRMTDG